MIVDVKKIAKAFREATHDMMIDTMTVKRVVKGEKDEWGVKQPSKTEIIYKDVKCQVSQMNQNFNNPNAESVDSIPVLYKLKVFAPQNLEILAGDLITITREVDGVKTIYKDKRASEPMPYENKIEFYIGIDDKA